MTKILVNSLGKPYISSNGNALEALPSGGSFIVIHSSLGATLTCGDQTYTLTGTETSHAFPVQSGIYTCTASKTGYETSTTTVTVTTDNVYEITLNLSRLPYEYQEVEYLQSNGSQYIDTRIIYSDTTVVEGSFRYPLLTGAVFGANISGSVPSAINMMIRSPYIAIKCNYGNTCQIAQDTNSHSFKIDKPNNIMSIDTTTATPGSVTNSYPLYLFAVNSSGIAADYGTVSVFNFKTTVSGVLTANFIPCYRKSDSKPGMYDTVSGTFFTNSGTGEFTVGPDV